MATVAKQDFSGSTDGRMIQVVAVATPGTLIHAAVADVSDWDEIYLYAVNIDTTDHLVTVEYGGVGAVNQIPTTIRAQAGNIFIIPGWVLQNGLLIRAFAAAANVINIGGFVNRIIA